jgi:acid phosphatase (class A)
MVIHQYNNRVVPEELQDAADNDMDGLFESYLDSRGLTYNTSYYKSLRLDLIPLIKLLKKHYNRLRPNQTATLLGIEFPGDTLKSAQTPSYPSGHTVQAFVLALKFSEQFPDHVDNLLSIAELISQSRIDRGVHFPSDIEFGRLIAYLIVEEMKDGTTP